MPIATQNRLKVTVSHKRLPPIDWDKASGGDRTHSSTKVRATAAGPKIVLTGDSEVENVTTEAFIDPVAYAGVLAALHAGEKYAGASITRQFVDAADIPVGPPITHMDCSVVKFTPPEADANGEDGSKLVVEWMVGG